MKPDLTFGRAMRLIGARWWVVLACALLVTVLGVSLGNRRLSNSTASVRLHEQDTGVAYLASGQPQPYTKARSVNELTRSDFVDPQIADTAARKAGRGMTGDGLTGALGFTPLNGTEVELSYSAGVSTAEARRRLDAYVSTLISARRASQRAQLLTAAQRVRSQGTAGAAAADRLRAAADGLAQQIFQVGSITSSKSRTIPGSAVFAGSVVAGLILGLLVALALGQADPRIRRLSDLRSAGFRAIEVDPSDARSIETLRAIVEVGGVDSTGGAVAVVASSGDGSQVGKELATSFAASGRPTTLLSNDGASRSSDEGWSTAEVGRHPLQSLRRLRDALADGRIGDVTVIDAPGVLQRPHGLIASAAADVTLLVLRRGRTTWRDLAQSLELLDESVGAGRVRICLERGGLLGRSSDALLRRNRPRARSLSS